MKHYQLDGMTVLVTGGSRGIGAAVVEAAARAGADIAFSWVSEGKQADRVAARARELGRRCIGYRSDVADPGQVAQMISAVEADFGRVDGLVNNAGIMPISPFLEMDPEEWDRVLRTDLYGPYYACRSVLPGMIARGSGSIVNVTSRLGQMGAVDLAHYCAAKAGVIGLNKSIGPRVRVEGDPGKCCRTRPHPDRHGHVRHARPGWTAIAGRVATRQIRRAWRGSRIGDLSTLCRRIVIHGSDPQPERRRVHAVRGRRRPGADYASAAESETVASEDPP